MRNPDLVRLYGKSLRGGLLLYGPPGCGKTFIARALAGEMGASFLPVSLADVLDMFIGQSERNVRSLFDTARRHAPCVIFLDEVDAIGQKRSNLRGGAARGTVNQLLSEMDGVAANNEGVFVLGATNHPWDVDVALRRPGRFDRMLLVLPPDEPARQALLRLNLENRPIANIDLARLARMTDGYSGADLAYVCETATEMALLDSARSGSARLIEMKDLDAALKQVRPSVGAWLDIARNVAQFANQSGSYDDLLDYLKARRSSTARPTWPGRARPSPGRLRSPPTSPGPTSCSELSLPPPEIPSPPSRLFAAPWRSTPRTPLPTTSSPAFSSVAAR
jgi:SpoVK/Ycf46/Vps4 family AAA+-type ATPase